MQDEADENTELLKKQKGFGSTFPGVLLQLGKFIGLTDILQECYFYRDYGMCYCYYQCGGV